jgi:hypothetical protein
MAWPGVYERECVCACVGVRVGVCGIALTESCGKYPEAGPDRYCVVSNPADEGLALTRDPFCMP